MHEDPTENRLGELGSLYKYYLLIILIIIIRLTLKAFPPEMARNLHDKDDHLAMPSSVGNTKTLSSVIWFLS